MKDLEDEIGVDLLRRSPRGVTLTAEGDCQDQKKPTNELDQRGLRSLDSSTRSLSLDLVPS